MKRRISIVAPHPDDEFIGCRKLIQEYASCIDNIVFVSNGERGLSSFPDMIEYVSIRRNESTNWVLNQNPDIQIFWLNVPDGIDTESINRIYGSEIFENITHNKPFRYLKFKIENIVGDNVIAVSNLEKHPTHQLAFTLCELLMNKKIYYSVHPIFLHNIRGVPGVYYNQKITELIKKYNYYVLYSNEEKEAKQKEFQEYYYSQHLSFQETGLVINNWESYFSEVPLKLCHEDHLRGIKRENGKFYFN